MVTDSHKTLNKILFDAGHYFTLTSEQYEIVMGANLIDLDPEGQKLLKRLQYSIRRGWVRITSTEINS